MSDKQFNLYSISPNVVNNKNRYREEEFRKYKK